MSRGEFGGASSSYGTISGEERAGDTRYSRNTHGGYQNPVGQDEFQYLCDTVASSVFQINNNVQALERIYRQLDSGREDVSQEKIHRIQQGTNKLAGETANCLKRMNLITSGGSAAKRQQRIQQERLKTEFQEGISRYQNVQKRVLEKKKSLVSRRGPGMDKSTPYLGGDLTYQDDHSANLLEDDRRRQEQQQMDQQIAMDEELIQQREENIRQLEADVLDVNEIFRDLATMVHEQGEMIDSIESNVERAHTNVDHGNVELEKASKYQKKARMRMCILLVILVVVALIITIVLVIQHQS